MQQKDPYRFPLLRASAARQTAAKRCLPFCASFLRGQPTAPVSRRKKQQAPKKHLHPLLFRAAERGERVIPLQDGGIDKPPDLIGRDTVEHGIFQHPPVQVAAHSGIAPLWNRETRFQIPAASAKHPPATMPPNPVEQLIHIEIGQRCRDRQKFPSPHMGAPCKIPRAAAEDSNRDRWENSVCMSHSRAHRPHSLP